MNQFIADFRRRSGGESVGLEANDHKLWPARLDPRDSNGHLKLGELYEEKFENSLPQAMKHYDQYVALGGSDARVREKVRAWRDLKKQFASPAAATGPDEEEQARELHQSAMKLLRAGNKVEALKDIEALLTKFGHTTYVTRQERIFKALVNSLRP